ncbi:MAG: substrate-binding domain-containing protein, partial [Chloroflexi bacterium]|nr:substrate-binding domain-containing protein [Chloroflexota bacterium]
MAYKTSYKWVASVLLLSMVVLSACVPAPTSVPPAQATAVVQPTAQPAAPVKQGQKQITIYMQMGGTQGDASTLARTNGAKAAAEALGIKLVEQYSGWDPQKMIDQFKQAAAANPDGIVIMGHPGEDAFASLVDQAESQGIIITSGNNPLP